MIDRGHRLPVTRQAHLVGLARSSVYYEPLATSERDLKLMAAIDEIHTELPFYGIRRLRGELIGRGFACGRQHVRTRGWPPRTHGNALPSRLGRRTSPACRGEPAF